MSTTEKSLVDNNIKNESNMLNEDNIKIIEEITKIPVIALGKENDKEYQSLIIDVLSEESNVIDVLYLVFKSFISDEISGFNSSVYYSSPEYLKYSYLEGKLLA